MSAKFPKEGEQNHLIDINKVLFRMAFWGLSFSFWVVNFIISSFHLALFCLFVFFFHLAFFGISSFSLARFRLFAAP